MIPWSNTSSTQTCTVCTIQKMTQTHLYVCMYALSLSLLTSCETALMWQWTERLIWSTAQNGLKWLIGEGVGDRHGEREPSCSPLMHDKLAPSTPSSVCSSASLTTSAAWSILTSRGSGLGLLTTASFITWGEGRGGVGVGHQMWCTFNKCCHCSSNEDIRHCNVHIYIGLPTDSVALHACHCPFVVGLRTSPIHIKQWQHTYVWIVQAYKYKLKVYLVASTHFVPPILPPQQQQLAKRKERKRRCRSLSQSRGSCGLPPCCWFGSPPEAGAGRCGRLRKYSSRPTIVLDHGRSDSTVQWHYEIYWTTYNRSLSMLLNSKGLLQVPYLVCVCVYAHM